MADDWQLLVEKLQRLLRLGRSAFHVLLHVDLGDLVDLSLDALRIDAGQTDGKDSRTFTAFFHGECSAQGFDRADARNFANPKNLTRFALQHRDE